MDTALKIGKVLWKLFWITCTIVAEIAFAPESPVCGPAEARRRRREGTITHDEFYKATRD